MTPQDALEQLISQTAAGDRAAFRALYDQTSLKLFGILLRVLGDRAQAEDALQDIYIKIWHNAGRYRVNGLSPMTWLITIARNHAIDLLRRRRRAQGAPLEDVAQLADGAPGPEAAAIASAERGRMAACLEALDQAHARAVRGAYLEGQTYAELAAAAGVPLNTMRTWLRRSLAKLKECLAQ